MIHRTLVLATALAALLVTPAQAGVPLVDYTLQGTGGQNGWYVSDVTVAWTVNWNGSTPISSTGCEFAVLVPGDTTATGTNRTCSATNSAGTATVTTSAFRIDKTKPTATGASAARAPDRSGWYNHSVGVSWTGSDAASGLASCSATTYAGPDSSTANPTGTCRDVAGNISAPFALPMKYDATPPTVAANPSRAANGAGWYAAPVTFAFGATDATSGVEACDPSQTYSGPDTTGASVSGACRDNAGNQATTGASFKYDATAPQVNLPAPDRTPNASGWFAAPVTFRATGSDPTSGIASCDSISYSGPDTSSGSVTGGCRDAAGNAASRTATVKYDATAPQVTSASPDRAADHAGWYVQPVTFTLAGSDATSGIGSCDAVRYSGPDTANASATGACRDNAGNSASRTVSLKYDATPPVVTGATPDRQPDQGGWYVKPVSFVFAGTDATSGLAGCDTIGYSGPDSGGASLTGACRDNAGNAGTRTVPLAYDATPPSFVAADAAAYDAAVTLTWRTVGDPAKILVTRTPGPGTLVFDGSDTRFDDEGLQNGVQYTYALTAVDAAGNAAQRSVVATPNVAAGARPVVVATTTPASTAAPTPTPAPGVATKKPSATKLIGPAFGARVTKPPLLRWKAVAKARYYNVQLRRNGRKILSLHPRRAQLQLRPSWTYHGKRYRLTPGRYEWFVWPGFGALSAGKFGPMLGASRFRVVARA